MPAYLKKMSTPYGQKIIERRRDGNIFIGDLYDECH